MRDNYVMVFDGYKWELRDRTYIIDEIYQTNMDILTDKFDEILDSLSHFAIRKFNRFLNDKEDDSLTTKIKNEIKMILYNNKNIPEETKRMLCSDFYNNELENNKKQLI